MIGRKRILRVIAVFSVALAAGQTVESLRSAGAGTKAGIAVALADSPTAMPGANLPMSASLAAGTAAGLPILAGITPVSAVADRSDKTACTPTLAVAAAEGATIRLSLVAPCHPGERVVIRHSGLSFTARTGVDGTLSLILPALEVDALVAAYFDGSTVALAQVSVPEAARVTRFVVQAAAPVQFDLRAVEGGVVYAGSGAHAREGLADRIVTLGTQSVAQPVVAQVYTFPAGTRDAIDLTVELRITADTCSRTFPVDTLLTRAGTLRQKTLAVAVPLCGTSGDILVLNNLVPAPTLAVQN